ncbi:chorismate synthase, partial [Pseudoflavonifractor phocaeensis]|nr:chorismate synthase [Pseudoflavonifractor phocaeensis]
GVPAKMHSFCGAGRHDPCIVHRAVPVIEAAAALATCELLGL